MHWLNQDFISLWYEERITEKPMYFYGDTQNYIGLDDQFKESEFRKKYGKRPFVPGNPDWLR